MEKEVRKGSLIKVKQVRKDILIIEKKRLERKQNQRNTGHKNTLIEAK